MPILINFEKLMNEIEFRNYNSNAKKSKVLTLNSVLKAFLHTRNRIRERKSFMGLQIFIENGSLSNNRMSNSRASFMRVSYGNLTVTFNLIENGSLSNNRTSN